MISEFFWAARGKIQHKPQTSRMVKENQWEYDGERYPQGELLIDADACENVKDEKARHRDQNRGRVIDVDGADKITLLAFEFQSAMSASEAHPEGPFVQPSGPAARTPETQSVEQNRQNSARHFTRSTLCMMRLSSRRGVILPSRHSGNRAGNGP